MIKLLVKLIAVASYKGGINKHSIILGLVHMLNPVTNGIILLFLGLLNPKVSTPLFLIVSLIFHVLIVLLMYRNFKYLEGIINKNELRAMKMRTREMYAFSYFLLVLIVGFLGLLMALYARVIVDFIYFNHSQ